MRKTIQRLDGPLFVAGKSRECANRQCSHQGTIYYAGRAWLYSLPFSTYGLDVLAYIGWCHEHEHKQLVEIQRELNGMGMAITERNVGKLSRQFLALLGGLDEQKQAKLAETTREHDKVAHGQYDDHVLGDSCRDARFGGFGLFFHSHRRAIQGLPMARM
jgi:hypothetical protein